MIFFGFLFLHTSVTTDASIYELNFTSIVPTLDAMILPFDILLVVSDAIWLTERLLPAGDLSFFFTGYNFLYLDDYPFWSQWYDSNYSIYYDYEIIHVLYDENILKQAKGTSERLERNAWD